MERILETLSHDLKKNEEIVKNFVFTNFFCTMNRKHI